MRVGISSWADPALIEARTFYPRKSMSAEDRLRFYAGFFDVVEVNASYYAIPDVLTVARWVERTPPGFVFHAKAWSLMTGHHPRAQTLPADVQALLPRHPRSTRRGEVLADEVPFDAVELARRLRAAGVDTRPFFLGLHEQPVLRDRGLFHDERYPVAERLARRGLYLPSGLTLTAAQLDRVCDAVREVLA